MALTRVPDVREEKVARAKRLVENFNYPPPENIIRIAHLLAINLNPEEQDKESN